MTGTLPAVAAVFAATLAVAGGLGGLALVLGDDGRRKRRLARAAGHRRTAAGAVAHGGPVSLRRDEVRGRFRGLELLLRRALPGRAKLRAALARAGLSISLGGYLAICLAVALALAATALALPVPLGPLAAGAVGVCAGWALPRLVVGYLAGRRVKRFLGDLPEAIDVMVRGLKSGLPVTETIATVARDFAGPVGREFKLVDDHLRLGTDLERALWDVAGRIDTAEFNFLAISIGLERETGGNLTETLANLAALLRRRQQMRLKVKALSAEARASAYLLSALPFVMAGLIYALNPDYMGRLLFEPQGHLLLGVAVASELMGVAVMAKMVRFEI